MRAWLFLLQALAAAAPCVAVPVPWRYEAKLAVNAKELDVEAWLPRGVDTTFSVDDGCERFVAAVEIEWAGRWTRVGHTSDVWRPPTDKPVHLRYRFHLAAAAAALHNIGQVGTRPGSAPAVTMASPAAWILRPWKAEPNTPLRIHCTTPEGIKLVTGLKTDADGSVIEDTYDHVDYAPYTAFGPFNLDRFTAGGVAVELATVPGSLSVSDPELKNWAAEAIANLRVVYGSFPTDRLVVLVLPSGGRGVVFGSTQGGGGPAVSILLARDATVDDLKQDWVLTHECIHLSHPGLPRDQHWFEEGLATYLEPLLRARRGLISPEEVWRNFMENLPNGLPKPGGQGLDRTRSWGATYWGGTLFCLLADVEIRQASGNKKSLDDALRGIVAAGGNHLARWSIGKTLDVGDRAAGGHVLRDLYRRMGTQAGSVDLDALFKQLGVEMRDGKAVFNEEAPLARARQDLTR